MAPPLTGWICDWCRKGRCERCDEDGCACPECGDYLPLLDDDDDEDE